MPPRKPTSEAVHVAPASPPMQAAPEPKPALAKECCGTCNAAVKRGDVLQCHGGTPTAIYRNVVMGYGPMGDALWPTVPATEWCRKWKPKT